MQAGNFRNPIDIQERIQEQDKYGQISIDWRTKKSVWGDVRYLSGTEQIRSSVESSQVKASVRIRYEAGITAGMRIVDIDNDTVLSIQAVTPDPKRKTYVDLACEVVNNDS